MDFKSSEKISINFDCAPCTKLKSNSGKIPVARIIEKLDDFFKVNNLNEAAKLLEYWQREAENIGDLSGELSVVNEMLGFYRRTSEEEKALFAVERAQKLIELTNSTFSLSGATILINMATTLKAFGILEEAVNTYEKACIIYEDKKISKDDPRYAPLYNNYATTLTDTGDFEKAEKLYKKAIEITSSNIKTLLDCAVSYVNLAHLYDKRNDSLAEEIEYCMSEAEKILEDERIKRDSYYAFVASKCAPSFDYFGYFVMAQKLNDKAREIYEGN